MARVTVFFCTNSLFEWSETAYQRHFSPPPLSRALSAAEELGGRGRGSVWRVFSRSCDRFCYRRTCTLSTPRNETPSKRGRELRCSLNLG